MGIRIDNEHNIDINFNICHGIIIQHQYSYDCYYGTAAFGSTFNRTKTITSKASGRAATSDGVSAAGHL